MPSKIGAMDIITKPKIGIRGFLEESAVLLGDTARGSDRPSESISRST